MAYVRAMAFLCVATMSVAGCVGTSEPIAPRPEASSGAASGPDATTSRYEAADVASDEVKAAANFAVAEQARRTGFTVTLGAIRRAEQQKAVVTSYRLCLDVDTEGSSEHAVAAVLRDQNQHSLTSWTNTPCE